MTTSSMNSKDSPKTVVIKERLTRKILRPVMSQFSSLTEALLELVDNTFDEFDGRQGGKKLEIDIIITKSVGAQAI